MTRHDRIHPIVTVADLPATVAFYEALGWEAVTAPSWAAAGAVTMAWEGCPQTFAEPGSALGDAEATTAGLGLILMVGDLEGALATLSFASIAATRGEAPWGAYLDVVDPAGTTLRFIARS